MTADRRQHLGAEAACPPSFLWHEQIGISWLGISRACAGDDAEAAGVAAADALGAAAAPRSAGAACAGDTGFAGADPAAPEFRGGLSARAGGVSPVPWDSLDLGLRTGDDPARVAENLALLARATGVDLPRAARISLEHGARVRLATGSGMAGAGDALVTTLPGLPLALTVADCFPLFLAAPGAVALAHCGWRGIAAGVAPATLAALCRAAGCDPSAARAWIGPGIGPCCYSLPEATACVFPEIARGAREESDAAGGGDSRATAGPAEGAQASLGGDPCRPSPTALAVDLAAWLRAQLAAAGIPAERIATSGLCTSCRAEWFYSHRRDRGKTGRMLAWIEALAPAGAALRE